MHDVPYTISTRDNGMLFCFRAEVEVNKRTFRFLECCRGLCSSTVAVLRAFLSFSVAFLRSPPSNRVSYNIQITLSTMCCSSPSFGLLTPRFCISYRLLLFSTPPSCLILPVLSPLSSRCYLPLSFNPLAFFPSVPYPPLSPFSYPSLGIILLISPTPPLAFSLSPIPLWHSPHIASPFGVCPSCPASPHSAPYPAPFDPYPPLAFLSNVPYPPVLPPPYPLFCPLYPFGVFRWRFLGWAVRIPGLG